MKAQSKTNWEKKMKDKATRQVFQDMKKEAAAAVKEKKKASRDRLILALYIMASCLSPSFSNLSLLCQQLLKSLNDSQACFENMCRLQQSKGRLLEKGRRQTGRRVWLSRR
jgi:hypothetical protein